VASCSVDLRVTVTPYLELGTLEEDPIELKALAPFGRRPSATTAGITSAGRASDTGS
jgi:hypothetical protein